MDSWFHHTKTHPYEVSPSRNSAAEKPKGCGKRTETSQRSINGSHTPSPDIRAGQAAPWRREFFASTLENLPIPCPGSEGSLAQLKAHLQAGLLADRHVVYGVLDVRLRRSVQNQLKRIPLDQIACPLKTGWFSTIRPKQQHPQHLQDNSGQPWSMKLYVFGIALSKAGASCSLCTKF